jgi:hypothetical protein
MSAAPKLNTEQIALKMSQALADAEAKVRIAAASVDAAAVFSSYSLYRMADMLGDRPTKHTRPAPAAVELAAWLLYPEFGRSTSRDGERIQAAITALEEHESAFTFAEMFPQLPADEADDDLAMHLRIHSGMVRGSAYPTQVVRRIEGVMKCLESELSALVGIGPCRACEIIRALTVQMEGNINSMRDALRKISAHGQALAVKGNVLTGDDRTQLAACGDEMRRILGTMEGEWSPTRDQIASRLGGVSESEWAALANAVGLTPVSRATLNKVVDVQDRPLFFLDDEHAFCLHGVACFDAVFTFFDNLARNDASLRDRYGRCIAEWMEVEIERQLQRLFPTASVIRNACFPDPDNAGGETEADVVVVWWPFLIVVDAKGKRVASEALRGSRTKLKQTIAKNIQDAFIQSRRVVRILERDGRIRFKEKATGRVIEVEQDRLRRVMPISVTLQNLSGIPTQLAVTQRLGLFKGNAYPWSVSIDDLDVITRFAGSPDVFLHYIERRTAHQSITVGMHGDELDIFGQYLGNRLHPSLYEGRKEIAEHTAGTTTIAFSDGDEDFEPFYMAEWNGEPPPSVTVGLKVPPPIQSVLSELRNRADDGARWVAFALLGLSHAALERLVSALEDMKSNLAQGQRILRITMHEGDVVINVLAHRGLTKGDFFKNVTIRSRMEHYRSRPLATVTIGIDQRDTSQPFEIAQWLEGPWEYEQVMERLLAEDREQPRIVQMPRGASKPGRNDPCPCGSGRKFKKCCVSQMTFKRAEARQ